MSNAFLVPKAGALVRDPATFQRLADTGEWKAMNAYWRRRIRDGDVIDETKGAATKAAPRPKRRRARSK